MYAKARLEQIRDFVEWASSAPALKLAPESLDTRTSPSAFSQFGDTARGDPWNQFNNWAQNMAGTTIR